MTPALGTAGAAQSAWWLVPRIAVFMYFLLSLSLFEILQILDDCISFVSGFRIYFGASSPDVSDWLKIVTQPDLICSYYRLQLYPPGTIRYS